MHVPHIHLSLGPITWCDCLIAMWVWLLSTLWWVCPGSLLRPSPTKQSLFPVFQGAAFTRPQVLFRLRLPLATRGSALPVLIRIAGYVTSSRDAQCAQAQPRAVGVPRGRGGAWRQHAPRRRGGVAGRGSARGRGGRGRPRSRDRRHIKERGAGNPVSGGRSRPGEAAGSEGGAARRGAGRGGASEPAGDGSKPGKVAGIWGPAPRTRAATPEPGLGGGADQPRAPLEPSRRAVLRHPS